MRPAHYAMAVSEYFYPGFEGAVGAESLAATQRELHGRARQARWRGLAHAARRRRAFGLNIPEVSSILKMGISVAFPATVPFGSEISNQQSAVAAMASPRI